MIENMVSTLLIGYHVLVRQQSAEELIKTLSALREPALASTSDADIAKWEKECDVVAERQGKLVLELLRVDPANTQTPKWLDSRWGSMEGHRMPPDKTRRDKISSDVMEFLQKPQLDPNRQVALRRQSRVKMLQSWVRMKDAKIKGSDPRATPFLKEGLAACDAYQKSFPSDDGGVFSITASARWQRAARMN